MNLADPHPTKDNPQALQPPAQKVPDQLKNTTPWVQTSKLPKELIETLVPAVEKDWE